jgi:hypothetical protein
MFVIARLVNAVAAKHEDNRSRGREHVFPADRAIAIRHPFYTFVGMLHGHGHTYTTRLGPLLAKESSTYVQ